MKLPSSDSESLELACWFFFFAIALVEVVVFMIISYVYLLFLSQNIEFRDNVRLIFKLFFSLQ